MTRRAALTLAPLMFVLDGCRAPGASPADGSLDARATDAALPPLDQGPPPDIGAAPSRCAFTGPLPAWASAPDPSRLMARCGDVTLHARAWAPGVIRLQYRGDATAPLPRPWAVVGVASPPRATFFGARGDRAGLCTPDLDVTLDSACRVVVQDASGSVLLEDGEGGGFSRGRVTVEAATARRGAPLAAARRRPAARVRRAQRPLRAAQHPRGVLEHRRLRQRPGRRGARGRSALRVHSVLGVAPRGRRLGHLLRRPAPHGGRGQRRPHRPRRRRRGGPIRLRRSALRRRAAALRRAHGARPPCPRDGRWATTSRAGATTTQRARSKRSPASFRALAHPRWTPMWLDIQHMRGFRTFTFDPARFGDPARWLAARLAAQGFRGGHHRRPRPQGGPRAGPSTARPATRALPARARRARLCRRGLAGRLVLPRLHAPAGPRVVGRGGRQPRARGPRRHLARRERAHGVPRERRRERAR